MENGVKPESHQSFSRNSRAWIKTLGMRWSLDHDSIDGERALRACESHGLIDIVKTFTLDLSALHHSIARYSAEGLTG
jgi:hypothetical protein